jgi:hypothetical protein
MVVVLAEVPNELLLLLEGEGQEGAATLLTREAGSALTPEYAAPEQFSRYRQAVVFRMRKPVGSGSVISKVSTCSPSRQLICLMVPSESMTAARPLPTGQGSRSPLRGTLNSLSGWVPLWARMRARGVHFILAPAMNIYRVPMFAPLQPLCLLLYSLISATAESVRYNSVSCEVIVLANPAGAQTASVRMGEKLAEVQLEENSVTTLVWS